MPRIEYKARNFSKRSLAIIQVANVIIKEYAEQGFDLTLRQLYYQFVSKDILPNTMKNYKLLGSIVNDGRLAGLIDWDAIVDRTRELVSTQHFDSPGDLVSAAANSYKVDRWEGQAIRPEVWIEKDALSGVFEGICRKLDVAYLSCRGYTSQSEMWTGGQRILNRFNETGQRTVILHFGDHDPSGMDMTHDIMGRLEMFVQNDPNDGAGDFSDACEVHRIALNTDQVRKYKPPPNPAKTTDSRAKRYISKFGHESWELDALSPKVLAALVKQWVQELVSDESMMEDQAQKEKDGQEAIRKVAKEHLSD